MTDQPEPSITGYCPACGRGDAAPTADDWEQQRKRADRAEAALREALAAFNITARDQPGGRILGYYAEAPIHPDEMDRWRAALQPATPAHNAGPTVREAAADDRAYWERKDAREGQ